MESTRIAHLAAQLPRGREGTTSTFGDWVASTSTMPTAAPYGGDLREELHDLLCVLTVESALDGVGGQLVDDDELDAAQLFEKFLGRLGHAEVNEDFSAPLELDGKRLQELQEPFGVAANKRVEGLGNADVLAGALPVEEPYPDPGGRASRRRGRSRQPCPYRSGWCRRQGGCSRRW
ncbi:hypothetical protein [Streptomyces sp. B1I3]|uniref:hypothetical protein n=1 Tax=Streptomyces sp. B1I3 TaxID=3042264 RepID=UPI00358FC21A